MNTSFEINSEYRLMENNELFYSLSKKDNLAALIQEQTQSEDITLSDIFENLTPERKRIALSAIELYRRMVNTSNQISIGSSNSAYSVMYPIMSGLDTEEFWVILLNSANRIIKRVRLSVGGLSQTVVDIRLIVKLAILNNAVGLIMCHNHPSGNTRPSREDDSITSKVKGGLESLNVKMLDHLIIGGDKYYSYSDEGRI